MFMLLCCPGTGAAPIHWAVINGRENRVTTMYMDQGMDTGIYSQEKLAIGELETQERSMTGWLVLELMCC